MRNSQIKMNSVALRARFVHLMESERSRREALTPDVHLVSEISWQTGGLTPGPFMTASPACRVGWASAGTAGCLLWFEPARTADTFIFGSR